MSPAVRAAGAAPRVTPRRGTLAVGAVCALAAAALAGSSGLLAGVLGSLLVVGFFASGAVPLFLAGQVGLRLRAGVTLLVLTYVMRLVLVLGTLGLAAQSGLVHGRSLGVTVVVCALAWSALQLAVVLRGPGGT